MSSFKSHRIDNSEARTGDIIIWKRTGLLAEVLSWLIQKLKEPDYDRWGWHMTPMISDTRFADAQFPVVKDASFDKYNLEFRTYRVSENPPTQAAIDNFCKTHLGKRYDWKVYIYTTLAQLLRPFIDVPRLIDCSYNCWEVTFDFLELSDFQPVENSDYDYNYPWLPDFLRCVGEMPLKNK